MANGNGENGRSRLTAISAWSLLLAAALVAGCSKERPVKPIIGNTSRVAKSALSGTYLYLKTISDVQSPGDQSEWMAPGMYMESDKLVQFNVKEHALEVVALDPQFQTERAARTNAVLASFKARNVDVLRKQNVDGEDTHEEEETETRNTWEKRGQVVIDITEDSVDSFKDSTIVANAATGIEIDEATGAINFLVTRRLKDDALVTVRHSFVKFTNNESYSPKQYPRDLQRRFGFFKTTTLGLDKYGRITTTERREIGNRWDANKPVVYYLSKNFPENLKPRAFEIFADWNASFKKAVGHDVVQLKENTGQELGDLRYSMITYDASETSLHGILGYGPAYTNPRTGEIIKADVILYGGSLKRSLYTERVWESLLAKKEETKAAAPVTGNGLMNLLNKLLPGGAGPTPAPPGVNHDAFLSVLMAPYLSERDAELAPGELAEMSIPAVEDRMDKSLLSLAADYQPVKAIREIKESYLKDHMKCITRVSEDSVRKLNEQKFAANRPLSDDELEVQIFTPLLTHELGHTLGLRHNFEGSADSKHFSKANTGAATKSSSVMDYGFLTSQEPSGVGSYDDAAIQVLYSEDEAHTSKLIGQNFFFCTDEHILDARNGLCNQFDTGISLTEMVQGQLDRYFTSFLFNNVKGDKVTFGSSKDYMSKIQRYLLPIRIAFDNAQAILNAGAAQNVAGFWYVAGQRVEADADSDPKKVTKIKVADSYAVAVSPGKWELQPHTVERSVDQAKIAAILKDAQAAQNLVFQAFLGILLDNERPIYSSGDLIHDELQIRGTLTDKLFSMMLLYSRTPDPSGNGGVITPFRDLKNGGAASFLGHLLANTTPVTDPTTKTLTSRLTPHDVNLRNMALNLLWTELATPGSTAGAREMLASEKVVVNKTAMARKATLKQALAALPGLREVLKKTQQDAADRVAKAQLVAAGIQAVLPTSPFVTLGATLASIPDLIAQSDAQTLLKQLDESEESSKKEIAALEASTTDEQRTMESIEEFRSAIRLRMQKLMLGGADEATQKQLQAEILALEAKRNQINVAYTNTLGDNFIKAPILLELQSHGSAVGRLVRDNLNRAEDQRQAALELATNMTKLVQAELEKPEGEQNQEMVIAAAQSMQQLNQRAAAIGEYIASEKMFVESMYHRYTGANP